MVAITVWSSGARWEDVGKLLLVIAQPIGISMRLLAILETFLFFFALAIDNFIPRSVRKRSPLRPVQKLNGIFR